MIASDSTSSRARILAAFSLSFAAHLLLFLPITGLQFESAPVAATSRLLRFTLVAPPKDADRHAEPPASSPSTSLASLSDQAEVSSRPVNVKPRAELQNSSRVSEVKRQPPPQPRLATRPPRVRDGLEKTTSAARTIVDEIPADNRSDAASSGAPLFVAPRLNGATNQKPRYPLAARRRGHEGKVLLVIEVDKDGSVRAVDVKESSGSSLLDRAAARAVQRWRFQPARLGAQAIVALVDVPVLFRLSDAD